MVRCLMTAPRRRASYSQGRQLPREHHRTPSLQEFIPQRHPSLPLRFPNRFPARWLRHPSQYTRSQDPDELNTFTTTPVASPHVECAVHHRLVSGLIHERGSSLRRHPSSDVLALGPLFPPMVGQVLRPTNNKGIASCSALG